MQLPRYRYHNVYGVVMMFSYIRTWNIPKAKFPTRTTFITTSCARTMWVTSVVFLHFTWIHVTETNSISILIPDGQKPAPPLSAESEVSRYGRHLICFLYFSLFLIPSGDQTLTSVCLTADVTSIDDLAFIDSDHNPSSITSLYLPS